MSVYLLNLCACLPVLLRMQMETKGAHAVMGTRGVGGQAGLVAQGTTGAGLVGWYRGVWGFHHMFGSPGIPIAIYIYMEEVMEALGFPY
jgi:hypothetical protein